MSACQEIRLTWDEVAKLYLIVAVDLNLLERQNAGGLLTEMVNERQGLLAKLDLMRTEAFRREKGGKSDGCA